MPAPSSMRKMSASSTEKVMVMQWFSLMAPQQPKKVTKKMTKPTTMRRTGALKKELPRKSRYWLYTDWITAPVTIRIRPVNCERNNVGFSVSDLYRLW